MTKLIGEKIEELEVQIKELRQAEKAEKVEKLRLKSELIGRMVLEKIKGDKQRKIQIMAELEKYLKKTSDRELFGLEKLKKP